MSLFNAMSITDFLCNNFKIVSSLNYFNEVPIYNIQFKELKSNRNTLASNLDTLLIKSNLLSSLSLDRHNNSFTHRKLSSPSFFTRFINKYWQETIFISKFNLVSEKYINQLKSDGISIYHNQYKQFLFDFSQALIKGRIITYLNDDTNMNMINHNPIDMRYIWRKGFNVFGLNKNKLLQLQQYKKRHLENAQVNLIKKLKNNKLPIFTVTNNSNEIIVAEPADELMYNHNLMDNLYQWYCNHILKFNDSRPRYEGIFFMNSVDALEYKQYIQQKYINYNIYHNQNILKIVPSSLHLYYKLVNSSHPRVKFYLIPDLKELGELIYKYQYYKNIVFHSKQKYGKHYFQGQPIYIIQPVYCKNKASKENQLVKYLYESGHNERNADYDTVFMSYKVASLAWQKFLDNNKNYNLPQKPKILVYNLEDFLKMYESDKALLKKNILFVPNQESYKFIKSIAKAVNHSKLQVLSSQLLYYKIIAKRLVWSLTSRQPVNW